MNNRSNTQNLFFSLAIFIVFALLFTSCMSSEQPIYKFQFHNLISFDMWDLNANGNIDKDELHTGIYKTLNTDGAFISQSEWKEANYFFITYPSNGYGSFKHWDDNKDNRLNDHEFTNCFSNSKLYRAWDKNSNEELNKAEFFAGLFDTWDINDDATLSSFERESWQEAAL